MERSNSNGLTHHEIALEHRCEVMEKDLDYYRTELRKLYRYLRKCEAAGKLVGPGDEGLPETESYWNKLGWEYDGFGTWASPGYHIVRPGKTQESEV